LNLGARSERMRINARDRFDPGAPGGAFGSGAPASNERQRASAYEAGLRIGVAEDAALIVRTSRSFRFANVDEIYEPSPAFTAEFQFLRPQRARTHEIGLALGRKLPWLQATLFRMDVEDEIHLDPFSTGVGNRNMPPLRRTGLELEARRTLGPALEVFAAYTLTRARFREGVLPGSAFSMANVDLSGRTVPLVPRHKLDLAADVRIGSHTHLRAEARYVSSQYMENDEGNTLGRRIPGYTVADVKLRHRMGPWTASLGVANVFDRKYYAYAVRSQFVADRFNAYPLPERSFWVGLEYSGL
jgi:iron complex outermembrane recepter protein